MTFAGLVLAVLTALANAQSYEEHPSHNAKKCVGEDGVYWGLTRPMFMDQLLGSIDNAIHEELHSNNLFHNQVFNGLDCQYKCAASVFFESAKVIHGSQLLLPEHRAVAKELVRNMFTGAIKACYPSASFNATLATSEKVLDAMVEPIVGVHPPAPPIQRICPGHPANLSPAAFVGYQSRFRECLDSTMADAQWAKVSDYFRSTGGMGFACQLECFDNAGQLAFENLFKSGVFGSAAGHQMLIESMTGSTRACFPMLQRPAVLGFWQAVNGCMAHAPPKQTCIPLDEELTVDGHQTSLDAFVASAEAAAKCAVSQVAASNPNVKNAIMASGSCQMQTCFPAILKSSARTLFRTKLLLAPAANEYASDVLTGTIKACYPEVAEADAAATGKAIFEAMQSNHGDCTELVPTNACPGKPEGGNEEQFHAVIAGMSSKLAQVQSSNEFVSLNNWLHENSFDCQQECVGENIQSTLTNLWTAGLFGKAACHANLAAAFSGALQSCYPRVPSSVTNEFSNAVVRLVNAGQIHCGGASANQQCIPPHRRIPAAGNINQGEFVEGFTKAADIAFDKMSEKTPGLLKVVEEKGDCQLSCFKDVITEGAKTIWGTQLLFEKQLVAKRMSASLEGAVTACYPGLEPESAVNIAAYIIDQTKDMDFPEAQKVVHSQLDIEQKINAKECPGKPVDTDKTDYVQFIKDFGDSFQATLKRPEFADLEKHVQSGSYTCQETCLNDVIAKSMQTLWQSGLFGSVPEHAMFVNSFTGAVRTCFPEVSLVKVQTLAKESLAQLDADMKAGVAKKYNSFIPKQRASDSGSSPKLFLGVAGASVAFLTVLFLVRASNRASSSPLRRLMISSATESFSQLEHSTLEAGGAVE